MSRNYWPQLKPGDLVDVIVPAGRPKPETLKGVQKFLDQWGLVGRISKNAVGRDLLCAQSKEIRWENLKKALQAKDSKMVWCVRGGYGSLHLLENLKKLKPQPAKCFLGYSDITTLHTFLNQKWGWATLHGPNIDRFALKTGSASEANRIKNVVFGKQTELSFVLRPLNTLGRKKQILRGKIVGGNLITLQSSFGTPYSIQPQGQFLFFEEIGERAYRIDRAFEHMRQLGLFKKVKAVIFGQFTEGQEPNGRNLVPTYLKQWAQDQNFPVVVGLSSGHGPNQRPLPLGTRAQLTLGPNVQLTTESGARSE